MQIDSGFRSPFADLQTLFRGSPTAIEEGRRLQPRSPLPVEESPSPLLATKGAERLSSMNRMAPAGVRMVDPGRFDATLMSREASMREETSLSLELTTAEGDVVSLQFRQADFSSMREDADGFSAEAGFERFVSLAVVGELSDDELSAIDNMIARVADEASSLLQGDLGAAAQRLASLGFDSDALASFSLNFRQATWQSMSSLYNAGTEPGLADLVRRDEGVASLLDGMASMQRRLIDDAMALFNTVDATRLGRSMVPAVFSFAAEPPRAEA